MKIRRFMTFAANRISETQRLADHSADRRMLMLAVMALVVGTGGAIGAWILLRLIAIATNLFWFGRISAQPAAITDTAIGYGIIIIPIIGSLIVGLMARYGSDKIRGHGIPEAIETILYGESRLSLKVALLKPLSSAVSIGSGGPFGAEGPIIMTGGAIGSLFAQCFHLSAAERKTLLVAGAAAGMTAIFGTPLAAILLAIEVLLFEWKPRSFVPVVVGVVVAFAWRPWMIGSGAMFPFAAQTPPGLWPIAAAAGVGILVGLEAALLSTSLYRVEDLFHRLPIHWMWWPAIGAVVVGIGGLIDAHVLGAGYQSIQALLDGALEMRIVLALLAVKAVVWLVALGSGTSGGVLAPFADPRRGRGMPDRACPARRFRLLGDDRHGRHHERRDARADHGRALRRRAHRPFRCPADHRHGGGVRLCDQRPADAAFDPDREDRAARPPRPPGI
jgi:CIC family chloride channel protein